MKPTDPIIRKHLNDAEQKFMADKQEVIQQQRNKGSDSENFHKAIANEKEKKRKKKKKMSKNDAGGKARKSRTSESRKKRSEKTKEERTSEWDIGGEATI